MDWPKASVHCAVSVFSQIEVANWEFLEYVLKTFSTPELMDLREVKSGLSVVSPEEMNAEAHPCLWQQASPLILTLPLNCHSSSLP